MDTNIKELNSSDEHVIDFKDLIRICSGVDSDGCTNSAAAIAINRINESKEVLEEQSTAFGAAVTNIFANGGCTVVQVDFSEENYFEARSAVGIVSDWMKNMNTDEYIDKFFVLTVAPLALGGQIFLTFFNLVYFTAYNLDQEKSKSNVRLILCFDNSGTRAYETDDINMDELIEIVDQELLAEERQLDEEAYGIRMEMQSLKDQNSFGNAVKQEYTQVDDEKKPEEESEHSKIRFRFNNDGLS